MVPNDRYQEIFQKGIQTAYPRFIHFVRSYPSGTIDVYPIPNKALTLGISSPNQLIQFQKASDIVCLPPGYKDCLALNLARKMAPEYGQPLDADILRMAMDTKAVLMSQNLEPVLMTTDLTMIQRRPYNIFSDQGR